MQAPPMGTSKPSTLKDIRAAIDGIDDAMHDLLMQRVALASSVAAAKAADDGTVRLRPAREAQVLRRLVARHSGPLPVAHVVRMWREVFAAMLAQQEGFSLAVFMPDRGAGYLSIARDHFGAYTPATAHRSAAQVLQAVSEGPASVGVLPMPGTAKTEPWWTGLADAASGATPVIVGRLPFAGPGEGRGDGLEALAVARVPLEPSGDDVAYLTLELTDDVSRARLRVLLDKAGLSAHAVLDKVTTGGVVRYLVTVPHFVAVDDPLLGALKSQDGVAVVALIGVQPAQLPVSGALT